MIITVHLYGLETCPLLKSDLSSVHFVIACFKYLTLLIYVYSKRKQKVISNCQIYSVVILTLLF